MKYLFLLFLILVAGLPAARSQSCYERFRRLGDVALEKKQYQVAVNNYQLAGRCDQISEAQRLQTWVWIKQALDANIRELQLLREEALAQKDRSDSLLVLAEARADELARKEQLIRRQAIDIEANRLALLSNIARKEGRRAEALFLGFTARSLAPDYPPVKQAFAQAVYDSLARRSAPQEAPVLSLLPLSDNQHVLFTLENNRIKVIDLSSGMLASPGAHRELIRTVTASPDGSRILTAGDEARLWEASGRLAADLEGHEAAVTAATFSPDGMELLTCSRDHTARLWTREGQYQTTLSGHDGNIYGVSFSGDGGHLLTRSSDGTVRVWTRQGEPKSTLDGGSGYVYAAAFSPDGSRILTAEADGRARLWNLSGELFSTLEGHQDVVVEAHFSPSGDYLLTRALDQTARLWEPDGKPRSVLQERQEGTMAIAFDRTGERIATVSTDSAIRIWSPAGRRLHVLPGYEQAVRQVEFSPDGRLLLTTLAGGSLNLWDIEGFQLLGASLPDAGSVPATFTPDGRYLLAVSGHFEIVFCPAPETAFRQLKAKEAFPAHLVEEWVAKYTVQTFQE